MIPIMQSTLRSISFSMPLSLHNHHALHRAAAATATHSSIARKSQAQKNKATSAPQFSTPALSQQHPACSLPSPRGLHSTNSRLHPWEWTQGGSKGGCLASFLRGAWKLRAVNCRLFSTYSGPKMQYRIPTGKPLPQVETPSTDSVICEPPIEQRAFKGLETNFPCLSRVKDSGPEPEYDNITKGYKLYTHTQPFPMRLNDGVLPQLEVAYETWGKLNEDSSNAVLVLAGLSASSHARSSVDNMKPGWWEKFIGPGCAVDTSKFFVICPNNLGGCYGSSGPSSVNVLTGKPYATTFPIICVADMVNAIFLLLDHLGIKKLYAAVGSSLGGMLSLQSAVSYPDRVARLISISACAQSHPSSIAMRYLQRKCIMCDPNWNKGYYYGKAYPKVGMKLAREIATITYRSGPEWNQRFGRDRISNDPPSLCPTFLIESYLEHQGESFSTKYDPNSLLYMSKAMDMFDIGEGYGSVEEGLSRVRCPVMIIGVQTDVLFPIWQQRELSDKLQSSGNEQVTYYELNSLYGHDTFLLDLNGVGGAVKGFLETEQRESGWLTKHKPGSKKTED